MWATAQAEGDEGRSLDLQIPGEMWYGGEGKGKGHDLQMPGAWMADDGSIVTKKKLMEALRKGEATELMKKLMQANESMKKLVR